MDLKRKAAASLPHSKKDSLAAAGDDESEIVQLFANAEFLNRILNIEQKLFR